MAGKDCPIPLQCALARLIAHAERDSGQSSRVANFLLSWWNADVCGGFSIVDAWNCDDQIVEDMITVFAAVAQLRLYPDSLGYENDFQAIVRRWRPEVV